MTATAVVFGGTGFLGRAVVAALVARDWRVRVAARRPDLAPLPDSVERCTVDVRDEQAIATAVAGAHAVINAVSLYVETGRLDFDAIHVHGAERIARLAAAAGNERLVHVSGIGVDSASESRYVRARARGESAVRAAFPNATVVRPSVMFGAGDSFLSTMDKMTRLPIIPLFGDGGMRLQPVHVEDVAQAIAMSLADKATAGTVFELGGAEVVRYRDILNAVLQQRGRRRILMPIPFSIWRGIARASALLPSPPVTVDQLALLSMDNVVGGEVPTFRDLGITPRGLIEQLPVCLGSRGTAPDSSPSDR